MIVIPINGVSLAGKDTFVRLVREYAEKDSCYIDCISTIDPVKIIYADLLGWDGEKTPAHRKNLNTLKTMWVENCNGPLRWVEEQIRASMLDNVEVLFVMVREFGEMICISSLGKRMTGYSGTLCVERPGIPIPPIEQDFLDSHPSHYKYDWTITNPTGIEFEKVLSGKAKAFWNIIKRGGVCMWE